MPNDTTLFVTMIIFDRQFSETNWQCMPLTVQKFKNQICFYSNQAKKTNSFSFGQTCACNSISHDQSGTKEQADATVPKLDHQISKNV
jgi:hypothetical protein